MILLLTMTVDVCSLWQNSDRSLCSPLLVSHLAVIVIVFAFLLSFCLCHPAGLYHTGCILAPQESDPIQKNFPTTPLCIVASSNFLWWQMLRERDICLTFLDYFQTWWVNVKRERTSSAPCLVFVDKEDDRPRLPVAEQGVNHLIQGVNQGVNQGVGRG